MKRGRIFIGCALALCLTFLFCRFLAALVQLIEECLNAFLVNEEEGRAVDIAWCHEALQTKIAVASGCEYLLFVEGAGGFRFRIVGQIGIGAYVPVAIEDVVCGVGQIEA